jgi:hypothetical protein
MACLPVTRSALFLPTYTRKQKIFYHPIARSMEAINITPYLSEEVYQTHLQLHKKLLLLRSGQRRLGLRRRAAHGAAHVVAEGNTPRWAAGAALRRTVLVPAFLAE